LRDSFWIQKGFAKEDLLADLLLPFLLFTHSFIHKHSIIIIYNSININNSTMAANCVIDRDVLNAETYPDFTEIGLSVFAPLCGKNRGAFVLNPTDGSTWGCAEFPPSFAKLANPEAHHHVTIKDSNAIKMQYDGGNITSLEAVDLVDLFVQSVFYSSEHVDLDPTACDVNGLTTLACPTSARTLPTMGRDKIRAVTLAGVLAPEPWATGGKSLTMKEAKHFYTEGDFEDMQTLGLNTVEIPVPLSVFGKHMSHHERNGKKELLEELLHYAHKAGLGAVIVLVGHDDSSESYHVIKEAAEYAAKSHNVIALSLPSSHHVAAARDASTKLPLFVPTSGLELTSLSTNDPYVFGALNLDHASASSIADVASDSSFNDRLKMFYHESIACSARSPIEYSACFRDVPLFVAAGFDASVDDCVNMDDAAKFKDYGQCGRLDETVDSHWWFVHRQSLIARQLTSFEKGLGWTYPAWKLFGDDDSNGLGVLDSSAKLKSLKHIAAAGILPSLLDDLPPAQLACLNPPLADFALGDDTVAPTAAPPPACDGGWYDFEEKKCAYWVPPPPTGAPTPCPSMPPAVECEVCPPVTVCPEPAAASALGAASMSVVPGLGGNNNFHTHSFVGGVMMTLVVGGIVMKLFTTMFKRGRSSYTVVPDHESLVV
jgi:hypothetical protein